MNVNIFSQMTHARTRPYSLQHRKDEGKRKRYILVLMIVMLCVYIGALQKSGIVVCQKQFQAFVVGKLGRNYKKNSITVWAQSMRGLPTTLFRPVFVNRGQRSVPGSKTTNRSGSVSGRRRMCPIQRSWERRI